MNTRLICASHSPLLYCYKREPERWNELQSAFKVQAEAIKAFDPELVIAFGSDHFNGFFLKMMPSFCVGFQATAVADIGGFPGPFDVPEDLAKKLAADLRGQKMDPGVSYKMTVDHAFSQTIQLMLGGLSARPVIPIFINCINPPFVPFIRSRLLGEAVSRFCTKLGKRVLFLASGGMSHHPTRYYPALGDAEEPVEAWQVSGGDDPKSLTKQQWLARLYTMHHEGAEMIARGERTSAQMHLNAEADRRFLTIMQENRLEDYDKWDQDELIAEAGIGSMELHTWIAGAAAHRQAGGNCPQISFYDVMPEIGIAAGVVYAD
ncbi:MAG: DODA-type extradiol aromatic ring-opening family dioxygenase [Desulforhopalus sp.]